jgi:hypothetical protein
MIDHIRIDNPACRGIEVENCERDIPWNENLVYLQFADHGIARVYLEAFVLSIEYPYPEILVSLVNDAELKQLRIIDFEYETLDALRRGGKLFFFES